MMNPIDLLAGLIVIAVAVFFVGGAYVAIMR